MQVKVEALSQELMAQGRQVQQTLVAAVVVQRVEDRARQMGVKVDRELSSSNILQLMARSLLAQV
jgi:hypothetical protein